MENHILVVNPGSTSTKFAVFSGGEPVFERSISHTGDQLASYKRVSDQFGFRKKMILEELAKSEINIDDIRIVVGRGGLLKPIESGIYEVNDPMKRDLESGERGEHASNLGGLIASDIASSLPDARAFIVDPVVVDEMEDVARYTGHPHFSRNSVFHALNQKAVSRLFASAEGKKYEDLNLVVAHMGGGISVGAHRKGRVVDVNNALNGDGPFSPERSGSLPVGQLADLCFSGEKSHAEVKDMITGKGGMTAYLGTNDFRDICKRAAEGDIEALGVQQAASYQIAKEIGAAATVLKGEVDAIILTGGMAYQEMNTSYITSMVSWIARVVVYPGEDELSALAYNGQMVLDGTALIRHYS
ncbi:MAG: butyrate kinase [Bacteroidales bacterium]|nr:butyrate kinase [Bacteroidales bacterium]